MIFRSTIEPDIFSEKHTELYFDQIINYIEGIKDNGLIVFDKDRILLNEVCDYLENEKIDNDIKIGFEYLTTNGLIHFDKTSKIKKRTFNEFSNLLLQKKHIDQSISSKDEFKSIFIKDYNKSDYEKKRREHFRKQINTLLYNYDDLKKGLSKILEFSPQIQYFDGSLGNYGGENKKFNKTYYNGIRNLLNIWSDSKYLSQTIKIMNIYTSPNYKFNKEKRKKEYCEKQLIELKQFYFHNLNHDFNDKHIFINLIVKDDPGNKMHDRLLITNYHNFNLTVGIQNFNDYKYEQPQRLTVIPKDDPIFYANLSYPDIVHHISRES